MRFCVARVLCAFTLFTSCGVFAMYDFFPEEPRREGDADFVRLIAHWQWDDVLWQHRAMLRLFDFYGLSPHLQKLRTNHFWQMMASIDPEGMHANYADPADSHGSTFLHKAVRLRDPELVQLVLRYQKDVNVQDKLRRTPLHYAVEGRYQDIADILLRAGAIGTIIDNAGKTPYEYAHEFGLHALADRIQYADETRGPDGLPVLQNQLEHARIASAPAAREVRFTNLASGRQRRGCHFCSH